VVAKFTNCRTGNYVSAGATAGLQPPALAQQLSLRHYDVSDGLVHAVVTSICRDTKGDLRISTFEGLSCFDSYRLTNALFSIHWFVVEFNKSLLFSNILEFSFL
jgi:hypothetical protein